jgi:putative transposon-encoded protein
MSMKPRHAAALALVGWYLMVPPMVYFEPMFEPNSSRMLIPPPFDRTWRVKATFNSANNCEVAREKHETDFTLSAKSAIPKSYEAHPNLSSPIDDGALCIATGDPRLKEK